VHRLVSLARFWHGDVRHRPMTTFLLVPGVWHGGWVWSEVAGLLTMVGHRPLCLTLTGLADRIADRFRALVFFDAMIAENGRSAIDLRNAQTLTHPVEVTASLPVPPLLAEVFGLEGAQAQRVDRLLTSQPWATYTQLISLTGAFESIGRKHYVRALRYDAAYLDTSYERAAADPSWTTERRDIGHDMMLIDPHWTAQVILTTSG